MATAQKRGDSYRLRVSCGYDASGKQIIKSITWTPDPGMTEKQIEKELERQKVLFEEKCKTGQFLSGNIKFSEFADIWMKDYAEKQLRARTVEWYRSLLPRTNAGIGHIRLDRLQPNHLIEFYNNLSENGIRNDIKYKSAVNFRSFLKDKKLTFKKAAEISSVSEFVISSLANGRNVNENSAKRISKALHVEFNDLFAKAPGSDKLSAETIRHYHRFISAVLGTAVYWQVIPANPCSRVKPPKAEKKEAHYLDEKEAAYMLQLLEKEDIRYRTMITLLLYTGMRRGEICGLEWDDLDFERNLIHIQRTSQYTAEKGIFTDETKNKSSARVIKAPSTAMELLRTFKAWQAEERLKLGDKWKNSGRIFTTWDGNPIHPDTVTGWFHDFAQRNDLPPVSIHSLRHTNATLLIASGVNIRTVSSRLGHSQTSTTTNIYSHAIRSADEAAAEVLEDILTPTKRKSKEMG